MSPGGQGLLSLRQVLAHDQALLLVRLELWLRVWPSPLLWCPHLPADLSPRLPLPVLQDQHPVLFLRQGQGASTLLVAALELRHQMRQATQVQLSFL